MRTDSNSGTIQTGLIPVAVRECHTHAHWLKIDWLALRIKQNAAVCGKGTERDATATNLRPPQAIDAIQAGPAQRIE